MIISEQKIDAITNIDIYDIVKLVILMHELFKKIEIMMAHIKIRVI
jgi:hypothetical protein